MNNKKVALVDDHTLLRNGLATLVRDFGYEILYERSNGRELVTQMDKDNLPDLVLMDINMPEMDGFEATLWLRDNYPLVNVLALSMYDDENSIIRMIRNGARGYVLKDSNPDELKRAMDAILTRGFHYSDLVTGKVIHNIRDNKDNNDTNQGHKLNERLIDFLKWACTEMTYKEIAGVMHVSPRTVDGYRDELFEKLNVKSRVGLVMFALKNGIVHFK